MGNNKITADSKLSDYVETYARERGISQKYIQILKCTAGRFEQWHLLTKGTECTLKTITDDLVTDWVIHLRDVEELGKSTLRGYRNNVLCIWRGAFQAKVIDHDPRRVIKVRVERGDPVAFTQEQLAAMLSEAEKLQGWFRQTGIKKADYFATFINVAYDTALRLGDILNLKRSDFTASGEASLIQNKTTRKHRVKLRPSTLEMVKGLFPPERELIFPLWARQEQFYVAFRELAHKAGCYKPNDLTRGIRRSSASYLERDNPGMASSHLGHRTYDLARRHYLDPRIVRQEITLPAAIDAPESPELETSKS